MADARDNDHSREFTCVECGRDIVVIVGAAWIEEDLCGMCVHVPAWFKDPALREVIDPSHNGEERALG